MMREKILSKMPNALGQLRFAKDVDPSAFRQKSPLFHKDLIEHFDKKGERKSAVIFRGGAKTTLINRAKTLSRIFFCKNLTL